MSKILLTGATGMVGRNLLEHPGFGAFELLTPTRRELNLLDSQAVLNYIDTHQPDWVIHVAGRVGGIQANMAAPVEFLMENLLMGQHVIMGAKTVGVPRLLNLGSSCMYPRNVPGVLTEEMVLTGELEPTNEGYALAKIVAARLCQYISKTSPGLQYKTLIPCNLYGRWDKFDPQHSHMIPAVIRKIHQAVQNGEDTVEIWGDGTARREFMYAADLADCVVRAIHHLDTLPDTANVGLGYDYTINQYYETIAKVIGFSGTFRHDLTKPVGMQRKLVSVERINAWGWEAQTSLEEGIQKTYEFYLEQEGMHRHDTVSVS